MNVYDLQLVNDGRILHHLGLMLQRDEHNTARPVGSFFSAAPTVSPEHSSTVHGSGPMATRQGGSIPTEGNTPLTVRCAWCDREQMLKADTLKAGRISHGICERHAAAMRAEIEQMHSERRAA